MNLPDLPESQDKEFWSEGESYRNTPVRIPICREHTNEGWQNSRTYRDNHDGSVSCTFCPWGTILAPYYRVHEGRIVDLRTLGSDHDASMAAQATFPGIANPA
jgi:hypothetical protein